MENRSGRSSHSPQMVLQPQCLCSGLRTVRRHLHSPPAGSAVAGAGLAPHNVWREHQPQKSSRSWIFLAARWAAALLILGILFYLLPVSPLRNALSRVPPTRFIAVLLIYLVALTGGITKWHTVVNSAGAQLSFAASAQCYTSGLFGALFLPSIIGGDVARLAVGISHSPRPAAVITGNVADRFLDVAAQLTLISLGLILLPGSLPVPPQGPAKRVLL